MAKTTAPVLAIGGITMANQSILNNKPIDWQVAIATGMAAGAFALLERLWEKGAVAFAWMALATLLLVRLDPKTPSPVESLARYMERKKG